MTICTTLLSPPPHIAPFSHCVTLTDPHRPAKSQKQRRKAAKAARKAAVDNPSSLLPIVPLEQQSIDLPAGNEGEAEQARDALRVAMRNARRKGIKEANFLKTMR